MKLEQIFEATIQNIVNAFIKRNPELQSKEELDKLYSDIHKFDKIKNNLKTDNPKEKDISYWSTRPYVEFHSFIYNNQDNLSNKKKKVLIKNSSIKVADNDKYIIIIPLSKEASCQYGSGTNWCISGRSYNEFSNYFNTYDSTIFILYDKLKNDKFAILFNLNSDIEIYDSSDNKLSTDELNDWMDDIGLFYNDFYHWYKIYEYKIEEYRNIDLEN